MKAERIERWRAVIEAAAEQSHCYRLPEITEPVQVDQLRRQLPEKVLLLVLDPSAQVPLSSSLDDSSASVLGYGLAVGPEGGWTERELEQMRVLGGRRVTLGPRILRARLAPVVATAILSGRL
jgi:16S rRNA (uracil1498-N3)-methyltransferase